MPPLLQAEHVGHALKMRRLLLGVDLIEIIQAAGMGHASDIRWTENALEPSQARVRWYHTWLTAAAKDRPAYVELPYAQREQWYDTPLDDALWHEAMRTNRQVAWWWGRSKGRGITGAWCRVCSEMIVPYDAGAGMSHPARVAVMQHRTKHTMAGIAPARMVRMMEAS